MKLKHILIFTVIILILSGCWSRKELNELAIVSTLSLDKIEDRYKVTAQVLNVNELAGAEQTTRLALAVYEEEGDTIFEAIRNITQHSPRKLYLSHLRLVIIGEELAKEGIKNALDFLARDHELRMDYFLTISKTGEASKLLKILTPIERIPAQKIYNTIEVSEAVWAPTSGVQMDEFLMKMTSLGGNPILTIINYKGDLEKGGKIANVETVNSDTELIIGNLAAFKGDKFAGRLGIEDSKGYNYIMNKVKNTVGSVSYKGGLVTVEIYNSNSDISSSVIDDKPKITIELTGEGGIAEVQYGGAIFEEDEILEIERIVEQTQVELLEQSINKAKKLQTDIFGFGDKIHKRHPKLWQQLKNNWHEVGFVELDIEVISTFQIRRTGTIKDSYQEGEN